jgi:hypothetical protein
VSPRADRKRQPTLARQPDRARNIRRIRRPQNRGRVPIDSTEEERPRLVIVRIPGSNDPTMQRVTQRLNRQST